jgi:hypothetical protein
MGALLKKCRSRGQAMMETMMVAGVLILTMVAFAALASVFLDYGYRTLKLISMEYP